MTDPLPIIAYAVRGSDRTLYTCVGEDEALFKALDLSKREPTVVFSVVALVERTAVVEALDRLSANEI